MKEVMGTLQEKHTSGLPMKASASNEVNYLESLLKVN